jgi:glycosyltransferase involved in cell wall biosynthesis
LDPLFWLSAARATLIVGINRSVAARWPLSLFARKKFVIQPAIGMEPVYGLPTARTHPKGAFRILSMGRLVPIKGFHLAIEAFAAFAHAHPAATMVVVGRGPERRRLEQRAASLGVLERIRFVDWLPRTSALEEMRKSDLFLFPSFEGGGMVVLEALAHGLPVVCLQYGGPGEVVSEACGRPVLPGGREETVRALAAALKEFAESPLVRAVKGGEAARRITDCCLWSSRRHVVSHWYDMCAHSVGHHASSAIMHRGQQAA